jgi:hypothetical protein
MTTRTFFTKRGPAFIVTQLIARQRQMDLGGERKLLGAEMGLVVENLRRLEARFLPEYVPMVRR